jgi:hypothetical protein
MLLGLAGLLVLLWIAGFLLHVAGAAIHALLVIALIVVIIHFVNGQRSARV